MNIELNLTSNQAFQLQSIAESDIFWRVFCKHGWQNMLQLPVIVMVESLECN
jgi:hypothetical protein